MLINRGKAVIFLVILVIIAVGLTGGTFFLLQQEVKKNSGLTQELEDVRARQQLTKIELEDANNKIAGLRVNLSDAQLKISDLSDSIEKEKASKDSSIKEIKKLEIELNRVRDEKAAIQKNFDDSIENLRVFESKFKNMEDKIIELENNKKELEEKVKGLEEKYQNVELGKIVVGSEQAVGETVAPQAGGAESAAKQLEGKIAVLNKDYNFAVINLGSQDGVSSGDIFSVTHDNKEAGDLKVEKVHDTMSAAGFVNPEMKDKIFEGDKVKLKK